MSPRLFVATSTIPLSSPERNGAKGLLAAAGGGGGGAGPGGGGGGLKGRTTTSASSSKLETIKQWSFNTYKCTKQMLSERFGKVRASAPSTEICKYTGALIDSAHLALKRNRKQQSERKSEESLGFLCMFVCTRLGRKREVPAQNLAKICKFPVSQMLGEAFPAKCLGQWCRNAHYM